MTNHSTNVGGDAYTVSMAKQESWRVIKTSGGYGVLKSTAGTKVKKSTVVRPNVAGKKVKGATKIGR